MWINAKTNKVFNKIVYDLSTSQAQESGIALDIKFQGLNGSLSNFAMRLEDFEIRAFEIVARYLQLQNAEPLIENMIDRILTIGKIRQQYNVCIFRPAKPFVNFMYCLFSNAFK